MSQTRSRVPVAPVPRTYARIPACRLLALLLGAQLAAGMPIRAEEEEEEPIANEDCLTCHESRELKKTDGIKVKSLYVSEEVLSASVHRSLSCVSCHPDVKELPHPEGTPIAPGSCVPCHDETVELHVSSVHGGGGIAGDREPVRCSACHGAPHSISGADDPESPTYRLNIPETCSGCHSELKMVVENLDPTLRKPFFAYRESVHGANVAKGSLEAAVCTDCHRSHEILPPSREKSSIFRFNIPATCGECHQAVLDVYRESVHGVNAAKTSRSPVCTDCHGIHTILSPVDPGSSVASQVIARTTCPQCHESLAVTQEIGIPANRLSSYLNSYHGLALQRGSKVVANCASCHGVHDIFPSSDPRSTVHPKRLPETCGNVNCHPGARENFTRGTFHEIGEADVGVGAVIIPWVERLYIVLIVATIGGMLLHNGLDLRRKSDPRFRVIPAVHLHEERLTRNQRIQHAVLASSFILLVLTGFALHYPNSWLSRLFGPGDEVRRFLHRVAAVAMVALGVYHVVYLGAKREGRKALRHMIPGLRDVHTAAAQVAFNLGWRSEPPEATHFGYAEKMEYWAVVWGTFVMALTGFLLWFKMFATTQLGLDLWILDLARVIHYYEAWLATLAIIVWHFYFVIFDPAVYPMNWAWLTGWIRGKHRRERAEARASDSGISA